MKVIRHYAVCRDPECRAETLIPKLPEGGYPWKPEFVCSKCGVPQTGEHWVDRQEDDVPA